MKRKLISVLTAACLFVTAAVSGGEPVFAVDTSGNCGAVGNESSVTWELDGDTLTISGNGPMADYYDNDDMPWHGSKSSIRSVVIGDGVTYIGQSAFQGFSALETVQFSDTVERIGYYAFMSCTSLKSPVFPSSIKTIEQQAFACCDSLDTLVLTGVTEIGYYAFQECSTGEFSYDIDELSRCKGLKSVSMPELTYMDRYAFSRCFNLESVSMPVLETIGDGAFSNCRMLKSINMPKVTEIGNYAFMGNPSLEILEIENVVTMGKQAFMDTSNATIFIPPNCTYKDNTFNSGTVVAEYTVTNNETPLTIIRADTDEVHFPEFVGCGKVISSNWEWYKNKRPRGKITHDGDHNPDESWICQICGEHVHNWGEWQTDRNDHWRYCEQLGKPGGCTYMDGYECEGHFNYYKDVYANDPTCTEDGNEWGQYCEKCGHVTFEPTVIPATGHDVEGQEWQSDDEQHWLICKTCGDEVDKADHQWDDGEITTPPTETEDGEKLITCTACGATKTELIHATGHDVDKQDWQFDGEQHWHTCKTCGDEVDKADHRWNGGEVTTEPTDITEGVKTYTCTDCGATKTESIPAKGHDAEGQEWQSDGEQHWHICKTCGDEVDKADHRWNSGEVTTEPTDTTEGVKTYTCTDCGATKNEPIPATGGTDTPGGTNNPGGSNTPGSTDNPNSTEAPSAPNAAEEVHAGENVPKTELVTPLDQILDIVLTDSEKTEDQEDIKIVLSIEDGTDMISPEDKAKVEAAVEKIEGCKIGQYLDVNLLKIVGGHQERITETSVPLKVSFEIPESLLGDDRKYSLISIYNGELTILPDLDDNDRTVTVEINEFFELVLIYEEAILSHSPELPDSNPSTGVLLSVIPAAAAITIITLSKRKNNSNKKSR